MAMNLVERNATQWRKLVAMVRSLPVVFGTSKLANARGVLVSELPAPGGEWLTNTTVTALPDGKLAVAVRQVSYFVDHRGRYINTTETPECYTWIGELDPVSLDVRGLMRMEQQTPTDLVMEDPRLLLTAQGLRGAWAVRDYRTGRYEIQMAVADVSEGRIENVRLIDSPHGSSLEKNWMPYFDSGAIHFLYRADRAERYRYNEGDILLVGRRPKPWESLKGHSGSSQLVRWREGWICVTHAHTVLSLPFRLAAWRFYRHHIVYFSEDFSSVTVSKPFNFLRRGIEFCAGLAEVNGHLYLGFGVRDRRAYIARLDPTAVDRIMKDSVEEA